MSIYRWASVLTASLLVTAVAATDPARAATGPTTLAVDGTVRVVVIDRFGDHAHADHLYSVETDDGAMIPVDLHGQAAANSRFRGELVVEGDVAADLRARGVMPRAGSTIREDTRAGRVAIASAEDESTPLRVAASSVTARAAAAAVPTEHRVYLAVMNGRGTLEESQEQIQAVVGSITDYWTAESGGLIASFPIVSTKTFTTSVAGSTEVSCGMATDPRFVWDEAARLFPGVPFAQSSRNHLVVAMADECSGSGVVGVAEIGTDLSSGGRMSLSLGSIAQQVGIHEMGHTFGLGHANVQRCAACAVDEYEDLFSPMGLAVTADFPLEPPALDTAFRRKLGVAGAAEVAQVSATNGPATRAVHVDPRGGLTGVRGVEIVDPLSGTRYHVEHRSGTARDAGTLYSYGANIGTGLVYRPGVTVTTAGTLDSITLLTPTPAAASFGVGQSFVSPSGSVRFLVAAAGGGGADLTVTFGPSAPAPPAPAPPAPAPPAPVPGRLAAKTPKITGTAKVGKTLKVKVGSWSPKPSFSYQWYAGGKKITSKGTKASLKLTARQKGKKITVRVTARKTGYTTVSKTSKATKKVARK
ncbi:hypothetical protein [Aeromicrobium wangtongii]|uniref:Peptidase M12B domain-containing protein n=1 Tax=Aeromicrobium wangtongii TaxID=2969247 RepID=A0ABY5M956_9ACTN|nr:hypothetical protein [Aeromicrobium wangtongii]MCD9199908.1 hypothetical protein [Aeromicrobium wangtongii]UUP13525.1 hypothetical protein NQV15_17000 [Aeromicrobium wangtongii]